MNKANKKENKGTKILIICGIITIIIIIGCVFFPNEIFGILKK